MNWPWFLRTTSSGRPRTKSGATPDLTGATPVLQIPTLKNPFSRQQIFPLSGETFIKSPGKNFSTGNNW